MSSIVVQGLDASRLVESKKQFLEQLKVRGVQAFADTANDIDYESLWKLKKADERGELEPTEESLLSVLQLDADELFGDEYKDERCEREFIAAWIEAALGFLAAAD